MPIMAAPKPKRMLRVVTYSTFGPGVQEIRPTAPRIEPEGLRRQVSLRGDGAVLAFRVVEAVEHVAGAPGRASRSPCRRRSSRRCRTRHARRSAGGSCAGRRPAGRRPFGRADSDRRRIEQQQVGLRAEGETAAEILDAVEIGGMAGQPADAFGQVEIAALAHPVRQEMQAEARVAHIDEVRAGVGERHHARPRASAGAPRPRRRH